MGQRYRPRAATFVALLCALVVLMGLPFLFGGTPAWAQFVEPPNPLGSLKTVPSPEPPNLNQFLNTNGKGITAGARAAAIALGKALFWDQAAGTDGQACASCHYNAGADSRSRNQVDPGLRAIPAQSVFGAMPPQQTTGVAAPFKADYQLGVGDFPLTKFLNQLDHRSGIVSDTQAVVSSQGVFNSIFGDIAPLQPCPNDQLFIGTICDSRTVNPLGNGAIFNTGSGFLTQVRNVEPRNTPSAINAVFNFRNFFDLRARNEFNGVDPIGDLDPYARVLISSGSGTGGTLKKVSLSGVLRLEDSALASQAVGPALSDMEMSAANRTFAKLGKKMLALPNALPAQLVAPDDSVLGNNTAASIKSDYPKPGINKKYADLIQAAFQPKWYGSNLIVTFVTNSDGTTATDPDGTVKLVFSKPPKSGALTTDQFTQMEYNFSLFWGIAIQMYEATLRADDSPFDQAFDSGNPLTFSSPLWGDQEKQGMLVFTGAGKCVNCHTGPELTNASVRNVRALALENMTMGNGSLAVYDTGVYNTAVRRCLDQKASIAATGQPGAACDDVGIGATIGPLNLPLSMSRFAQLVFAHNPNDPADPITIVCTNQPAACNNSLLIAVSPSQRVAVDGAFKTPGLRNIELTSPYMHNGSELTLMDIVNFYDRGGNFPEYNIDNLDPDIGGNDPAIDPVIDPVTGIVNVKPLGLSDIEKAELVAFMNALTDERVRFQRAPFDHPQLFVPNLPPDPNCPACKPGELPAVGRNGINTALPTFSQNLQ